MARLIMAFREILLFVVVLGVAGGCAVDRAMDHAVASWRNQPASAVIADWGQPSEELRVSGKHLLLWNTSDGTLVLPDQKRPSPRSAVLNCLRLLEVGRNGRIISGTWEGNGCPGRFSGWSR